jgi:hypothetical protein
MSEANLSSKSPDPTKSGTSASAFKLRAATQADVAFIFNSWLKSFKNANAVRGILPPVYFEFQHKVIEALLQRANVQVACNPAAENEIWGYAVYETVEGVSVLHYAYVKELYRGLGVYRALVAGLGDGGFYTHETSAFSGLRKKATQKWIYNPYLAWNIR